MGESETGFCWCGCPPESGKCMRMGILGPRGVDKFTTHEDFHRGNGIMYENGNYLPGRQGSLTWRPSQHICAPDRRRMLDEQ